MVELPYLTKQNCYQLNGALEFLIRKIKSKRLK